MRRCGCSCASWGSCSLDGGLLNEAIQTGSVLPAGHDWTDSFSYSSGSGVDLFGGLGDELALPEDGFAKSKFLFVPRFNGPRGFEAYLART